MQKDAFKPPGREISVMGMGNPLMGQGNVGPRMIQTGSPPPQGRQVQPAMAPPRGGGGAPISNRSDSFKPMGQPVRIMGGGAPGLDGGAVDRGASFQPSQPSLAPVPAPAPSPEMGNVPQAPRPFLQRTQNGTVIFRVTMRGRSPDGAEYASVYDAEFPPGTQPLHLDYAPLT